MITLRNARVQKKNTNINYYNELNRSDIHLNVDNRLIRFKDKQSLKNIQNNEVLDKEESTIFKNENFNWIHYILLNTDLFYAKITTREGALNHWNEHGKGENRRTVFESKEYSDYLHLYVHFKSLIVVSFFESTMEELLKQTYNLKQWNLFNAYPNLFHKYLLFLRNPNDNINYKVAKRIKITKKYICCIHCFDLNFFENFFDDYIEIISQYFDIVVTYCLDNCLVVDKYDYTFINSQNIGMDIGGKFIAIRYLDDMSIDYDYVFFMHSKTDKNKRKSYIEPLTKNLKEINYIMNADKNVGAFMPPWIYIGCMPLMYGDYNYTNYDIEKFGINDIYINELTEYMNAPNNCFFLEGNVFILNKILAKELYSNIYLYNILNTVDSFDYNWVNNFYSLGHNEYSTCYRTCRELKLHPNNLSTKLGHSGLADGMIEHSFERMLFPLLEKHKMHTMFFDKYPNQRLDNFNRILDKRTITNSIKYEIINTYENTVKYYKKVCVMACHTDSIYKYYNIINNMFYLLEHFDIFYLINSDEYRSDNVLETRLVEKYPNIVIYNKLSTEQLNYYRSQNDDLSNLNDEQLNYHFFKMGIHEERVGTNYKTVRIIYIPNTNLVCYDKYLYFFNNIDLAFNKIMVTNDSFLITKPLTEFIKLSNNGCELTGLSSSNEVKCHYPDFLRIYNNSGFIKTMEFIRIKCNEYTSFYDLIMDIEINSTELFTSKCCLYEIDSNFFGNIHFDDAKCYEYLYDLNYPILKLKKITSTYYSSPDLPEDFDPEIYRSLHLDLNHLINTTEHFLLFGMKEGRRYKHDQKMTLPEYLLTYLNNYIENNRDICLYEKF